MVKTIIPRVDRTTAGKELDFHVHGYLVGNYSFISFLLNKEELGTIQGRELKQLCQTILDKFKGDER